MSKRAEEAARKAYPDYWKCYPFETNKEARAAFIKGYELAEKGTIERCVAWLKEHANDYIVDLTPTYPDAPVNIIVGGKCWEDLKEYMEDE